MNNLGEQHGTAQFWKSPGSISTTLGHMEGTRNAGPPPAGRSLTGKMASKENIPAEANPSLGIYLPEGAGDQIALVPSAMLAELISQTVALMGTVEKLSVDLVATNPSVVDSVRLPKGLMIQTLTSRQIEVLSWMAQGFSNSAIAERLVISRKTVENYINHIYQSLQLVHEDDECPRVLAVLDYIEYILGSPANNGMVLQESHKRVANL